MKTRRKGILKTSYPLIRFEVYINVAHAFVNNRGTSHGPRSVCRLLKSAPQYIKEKQKKSSNVKQHLDLPGKYPLWGQFPIPYYSQKV